MEGWIKLHRRIVENPYYFSEPFTRSQAWIDLLIIANHKEGFFFKRGIKVVVKVGEVGYDLDTLSKRWRWSRGKAERFLNELEKDNQIVRQKTNITTILSIVNYSKYQTERKANDKPSSKADGQQTVKQTDTNKNVKNDNNEKKEGEIGFVFFEPRLQIQAEFFKDGIRYGNSHERNNGGLSEKTLREHCKEKGIKYVEL
jgi:hypothetical protein